MAPQVLKEDCWDNDGQGGIDVDMSPECNPFTSTTTGTVDGESPVAVIPRTDHEWTVDETMVLVGAVAVTFAAVGAVCTGGCYYNCDNFSILLNFIFAVVCCVFRRRLMAPPQPIGANQNLWVNVAAQVGSN